MKRKLLTSDDIDTNIINCINGYFIENTMICNCYPGWTSSNYDSINQCDIDTGMNNTLSDTRIINEGNNKMKDKSSSIIIMRIGMIILALTLIYCVILYCYKKWKNIKLIKQKIKYQKNLNKKIELELSLKLDEIGNENKEAQQSCNQSKGNKTISKECEQKNNNTIYEQKKELINIPVKTPIKKDSNL